MCEREVQIGNPAKLRNGLFMTEAELKKHLDSAEKSPKQIAAAVSGLPDKILHYKSSPESGAS